jgi:hypothetical protein
VIAPPLAELASDKAYGRDHQSSVRANRIVHLSRIALRWRPDISEEEQEIREAPAAESTARTFPVRLSGTRDASTA